MSRSHIVGQDVELKDIISSLTCELSVCSGERIVSISRRVPLIVLLCQLSFANHLAALRIASLRDVFIYPRESGAMVKFSCKEPFP